MIKYIDADRFRVEIENLIERYSSIKAKGVLQEGYKGGRLIGYKDTLNKLDSLQQEQQEIDLEKEIETSIRLLNGLHTFEDNKNWYKGRYEELKEFAHYFYEFGRLNARKEE